VPLKRYVIQETTENRVTFYFRSPREGNYYITVFAQQVDICGLQKSCFIADSNILRIELRC